MLHSICQQIWKTQQWPQDWKRSVFIPIPKKSSVKECSIYHTIALISHASKVMFKILQARLQQYMNCKLQDVQARFRIGRGVRDQIANIHWIIEKKTMRIPEKHLLQLYWLHQSLCVDHNKLSSLVAQSVKSLPAMWEIWVLSLGQGKPLIRKWLPTLVLLPREFHQQRALVGYSSWGHKDSDTTEWLTLSTYCGKFFKRWVYQTTLPISWEIRVQIKKQQLEPDIEQWAGSKLGKEYIKAIYCHPAYLTSMHSTYG